MKKLILVLGFMFGQCAAKPIVTNAAIGMFGDKYQGDIKLNGAQKAILLDNNSKNMSTNTGWTYEGFRWPHDTNGLVIVPYTIDFLEGGFCKEYSSSFPFF